MSSSYSYAKTHLRGYLIRSFFLNKKQSDVTLVVDGNRLFAHKLVLSAKSPIFKKMFFGKDFKESNTKDIELKDYNLSAFKILLKYCYNEELSPNDWPNGDYKLVIEVFKCAHFYEIKSLCLICSLKLIGLISVDNVIDILDLGLLYRLKRIIVFIKKFAKHHKNVLIASEDFLNCKSIKAIKLLMKSFCFVSQMEAIQTLVAIVSNTTEWGLTQFTDCLQIDKLSIDDLKYIQNNDLNAFQEIAIKRIINLMETNIELNRQNQIMTQRINNIRVRTVEPFPNFDWISERLDPNDDWAMGAIDDTDD